MKTLVSCLLLLMLIVGLVPVMASRDCRTIANDYLKTIIQGGNESNASPMEETLLNTTQRTLNRDFYNLELSRWQDFAKAESGEAELVIGLEATSDQESVALTKFISDNGGRIVERISAGNTAKAIVVNAPLESVGALATRLEGSGLCRYFEPNGKVEADFVPNDPRWSQQWGPQKIEADYAWNTTRGNSSVLIAVVDTGVDYTHPDLAPNYVPLGYDWVNNDDDPMDDNQHGTHCAGIIAATLNNGVGVAGIAQVSVMAEKFLSSEGWGYETDGAKAIIHAVDQGARILSCSWGGGESELIHDAIKYAWSKGVLVIAAAGNTASSFEHYPAAHDEVVAVVATDSFDYPAAFTTFGDWVEVSAPGVTILSTVPNNGYRELSGTSMACPHVAGVASLILSRFPNLTNSQLRQMLLYATDDLGDPGFDVYYGYGRINARKAVEQSIPEHDVVLSNWVVPSYVEPNEVGLVQATTYNFGTENEGDVEVQLLANGIVVSSGTIPFLAVDSSVNLTLSWVPTVEGTYNVTVHLLPVLGETNLDFSVRSAFVDVGVATRISVVDSAGTVDSLFIQEVWSKLNRDWRFFGDKMIHVDYTSLRKFNFSYEDIKATRADVLFISAPWFREYTDGELDAISRYVYEGHGLIGTYSAFGYSSFSNNRKLASLFGVNGSVGWTEDTLDVLNVLDANHPLFVNIPTSFNLEECGILGTIPSNGFWDSNELLGGTYVAKGSASRSAVVTFRGLVYMSPVIEALVASDYGTLYSLQLLYNAMIWSRYERPEHELIASVEAPGLLAPDEQARINLTVSNVGQANETNVVLHLGINGTIVDSYSIPLLSNGSVFTYTSTWEPSTLGFYNVTAFVDPVSGEDDTWNNADSVWIAVQVPPDILVVADNEDENPKGVTRTSLQEFKTALDLSGQEYYVWERRTMGSPPSDFLAHFRLVIWTLGTDGGGFPLSIPDQVKLVDYAKQGGKIILDSDYVAYLPTALEYTDFLKYVLHATYVDWTWPLQGGAEGIRVVKRDHLVACGLPEQILWDTIPVHASGVDPAFGGVAIVNYIDQFHPPSPAFFSPIKSWGAVVVSAGEDQRGSTVFFSFPFFALAEEQRNRMVENMLNWLFPKEHEVFLAVSPFKDGFQDVSTPAWINTTVVNWGQSNETNVELRIWVNGTLVNSTILPSLDAYSSVKYSYAWVAGTVGSYNLTVEVLPVPGEVVLNDNIATESVKVRGLVVALMSDETELRSVVPILESMGLGYHVYDYNKYLNYSRSYDLLSAYRAVVLSKNGRFTSMTEYTALQSYLDSGGNLLVTGEGCLITTGPTRVDSRMCDVVHARCFGIYATDQPHALFVVDDFHPIMDGPYGKFSAGYSTALLSPYSENATADTSRGSVTVAKCVSASCPADKIIATRLESGRVAFWNGKGYDDWGMNVDCAAMFRNLLNWFEFGQLHDLAVTLKVPSSVEPNASVTLKASVRNMGYHDENDVRLCLFIDDMSVSMVELPVLTRNASSSLYYAWTPSGEGVYNVTAYVPLVPDEDSQADNVFSVLVYVDVTPPAIGTPSQIPDQTEVQPYENVTVSVEVTDAGVGVREVILSYSIRGSPTWTNVTMNRVDGDTYSAVIPGFGAGTRVQYMIIACDWANNSAATGASGEYYVYTVVPEYQAFTILILMVIVLIATVMTKTESQRSGVRKRSRCSGTS